MNFIIINNDNIIIHKTNSSTVVLSERTTMGGIHAFRQKHLYTYVLSHTRLINLWADYIKF